MFNPLKINIMGTIAKIKPVGLTKLNNAEYENFMSRFRGLIPPGESERPDEISLLSANNPLGITDAQRSAFDDDLALLVDLVNQSRISDETAQMLDLDKQRDDLVVFITSSVSQMKKSPLPAQRSAAQTVYNIIKPYVGIYRSPNQQETAQIEGLLVDLAKSGIPELIKTLGLTDVIAALREANTGYASLTAQRTNNKAVISIKDKSLAVRMRMDALYDDMATMAFVQSVANPSTEATLFINRLNALIDETSALYNQRIAAAKAAKKPDESDKPDMMS